MKKVYSLIFILTLVLTLGLVTNVKASASLTTSNGGQITVTRNITRVINPVSNTFTYTIEADSNNPAAVTGLPSTMNIVFNRVTPTNLNEYGYGTSTQTGTLDLTGVTFPKVGDYLFTLRETNSTNISYPVDSANYYTIKVSVRYEVDSNNVPTSTMTARVANIKDSNNAKVNDVVFSEYFNFNAIEISKQVRGNMADKDEYFKIKVNIDCLTGDKYFINYRNEDGTDVLASITYNGSTINRMPNSYTYEDGGETYTEYWGTYTCGVDNYIYLKHGETAEIDGLLYGQEYSFVEQGALLYKTYINGSENDSKSSGNLIVGLDVYYADGREKSRKASDVQKPVNLREIDNNAKTINLTQAQVIDKDLNFIINEYDSIIDTGLVLKFLPYILILLTGIIGLTLFIVFKKKHKKDEEVEE